MKDNIKIKVMQKLIDDLQSDNQKLNEENKILKEELNSIKGNPDDDYEKKKQLDIMIKKYIDEYKEINMELKETKEKYEEEILKLKKLRVEYNKKMKNVVKSIKKDFDV